MNITQMIKASRNLVKYSALGLAAAAMLGVETAQAVAPVTDGLVLHLDASDSSTMTLDGTTVTEWRDLQGGGGKATLRGGSPTLVASGIGDIPTVHFDNSAWMNDSVNHSAPVTIFYVSRQTGGSNGRVLGACNNNWLMGYHGDQRSRFYFEGWVAGESDGLSPDTNPHLYAATIGGDGQNSTVWAEGTQLASNQNGTQGPNDLELNGYSNGNELSDVDISEVLVYNRVLSPTELDLVGGYLTVKYALDTAYPPPGPPAAPTGLTASPLHNGVRLDWTAVFGATGYNVYRGTETGVYDPTAIAATTAPTYQDKDPALVNGTTYYYVVKGTNASGEGDASNEAFAAPSADPVGQTITFGALASKTVGDPNYDLTATSSSELAVSYDSSDKSVATVAGSTVTILKSGVTTIIASQDGNDDFTAATPVEQTLTVVMADQTITFTLGSALVKQVSAVPFADTATGGASGNPVTYSSSNEGVATVDASGLITIVGLGVTQIRANQLGVPEYYNAAPEVTQSITVIPPLSLPVTEGMTCWFDANKDVTYDESGTVSAWADQSGLEHHAVSGGGTVTRAASQFAGYPAVQFRGSYLNLAVEMFTAQQYLVMRAPGSTWNGSGCFMGPTGPGYDGGNYPEGEDWRWWRIYDMRNGDIAFWPDPAPFGVSKNGVAIDPQWGDNFVYPIPPIDQYMLLKINVNTTERGGARSPALYQIGKSADVGTIDFDVCEIIAYDRILSDVEENALNGYLATKYGLTVAPVPVALNIAADATGSEIKNDGRLVEANHFYGTEASVTLDNGLTFGTDWSHTSPAGWSGGQNTSSDAYGCVPLLTDDTPFGRLMRNYTWSSEDTHTLTIPGLIPGHTYRLQLISVAGKGAGVVVEGAPSVKWTDTSSGTPSVLSFTWVQSPGDTELNVVVTRNHSFPGAHDNELATNGYALHDVTTYPAGTVLIIW